LTPAFPADDAPGWYALGPVAVAPELQRRGIGSRLIRTCLDWLQRPTQNAAGCILVGNPEYYRRFGFLPFPALAPSNVPAQFFQILPLAVDDNPSGSSDRMIRTPTVVVEFHPLFFAEE
jgi:putative acetyltransferase